MKNITRTRIEKESNYFAIYKDGKTVRFTIDDDKPISPLKSPEFFDIKLTSFCQGKCDFCFLPNTLINSSEGVIPIQNIKIGDHVIGWNKYTEKKTEQIVEQVFERNYGGAMIKLQFIDDETILSLTPNHQVFTFDRGWVEAGNLCIKDEVKALYGGMGLRSIYTYRYTGKVYNIGTTPDHNYFAEGMLVHNCYMNSTDDSAHVTDAVEKIENFFGSMGMNERPFQVACLHANTEIFTPNGMIRIKDLKIGDIVYDSNGKESKIVNLVVSKRECIQLLGYQSKSNVDDFPIICTPDHPFIVGGEIVEAKNLGATYLDLMPILSNYGIRKFAVYEEIEEVGEHIVYDITLDDESSHIIVLKYGVLSHNCGGGNPNQHSNFVQILEKFDELSITPNYTTNGMGLTSEVLQATEKYCGGVAVSCHPHLKEHWTSGIKTLSQLRGLKLSLHHIIFDIESVEKFLFIFNHSKFDDLVHYHVLLPQIAQGRARKGFERDAVEYLFSRLGKLPSYRQRKVSFGARLYDDLIENQSKLPGISLYGPEDFSKFLDLKDMKIYGSSFEASAI